MTEVEQHRDVDLTWAVMSLKYLNEGREIDGDYRERLERTQHLSGAAAAARLRHGDAVVGPMYTALGTRVHPGGRSDVERIIAEACEEVGIDPLTVSQIAADEVQDALRQGTAAVIAKVGDDVGTPTIDIDGASFFGPVVTPAPTGQAALDLWDGCVLVARTRGFYEIKRSRADGPIFD